MIRDIVKSGMKLLNEGMTGGKRIRRNKHFHGVH